MESHIIDYNALVSDDFDSYFFALAKCIMKVIEKAMGKTIDDKGWNKQFIYLVVVLRTNHLKNSRGCIWITMLN